MELFNYEWLHVYSSTSVNKKLVLYLLLISFSCCSAQGVILFTQSGCSNCAYVKNTLSEHHITFQEHPLSQNENASKMHAYLKRYQYTNTIYLPVIIYNDILLFPSTTTPLEDVVQGLTKEQDKFLKYYVIAETKNDTVDSYYIQQNHRDMGFEQAGHFSKAEKIYYYIDYYESFEDASSCLLHQIANFERLYIKEF